MVYSVLSMKSRQISVDVRNKSILLVLLLGFAFPWVAGAQITVQGDLAHELELLPGMTHSGSIVLRNGGTTPAEVKMYQTDYRSEVPRQHFYEDPGTTPRSNAAWISISPMRFTVPAGESYTVSYVLEVPADSSLGGTFWSVLMIEPIPPESPESVDAVPNETSVGIITLIRYGFKFVTHIGTSGTV
jgi:hypothetical protein